MANYSVNLDRYRTSYLVGFFSVSRATVATWKRKKAIPMKYAKGIVKLLTL